MRKHRRVLVALVLVGIGAAALWELLTREPAYEGKPVSAWLQDMSEEDSRARDKADSVLSTNGPEVIPHLIRALKRRNSTLSRAYYAVHRKVPMFVRESMPYPKNQGTYGFNATLILAKFGPAAASAVPQLRESLKDDDSRVRYGAARALGSIGPIARDAIRDLLVVANSSDVDCRVDGAWALWKVDPTGQTATATRILTNVVAEYYGAGWTAVGALAEMGQLHLAVSLLVEALMASDPNQRIHAASLMGQTGLHAKEAIDALTAALDDSDARVRKTVAKALGSIGPEARSALPKLREELKGVEGISRTIYAEAIRKIDSGTADAQK